MNRKSLFFLAASSLALGACDDGGGGEAETGAGGATSSADADAAAGALSPRDYYDAAARARCDRAQRCGMPIETSVEACVAKYESSSEPKRSRFIEAIVDGSMSYDSGLAADCITLYEDECADDDIRRILPVCNAVTDGLLAVGADCFAHAQCKVGNGVPGRCFEGCRGLFGEEEPQGNGQCVETSPIGTPACP